MKKFREVLWNHMTNQYRSCIDYLPKDNTQECSTINVKLFKSIDYKNSDKMYDLMKSTLIDSLKNQLTVFQLDEPMLLQMSADPSDRIFNQEELPETFLELRKIVRVDFEYRINPRVNLEKLKQEMRIKLTKTKMETKIEKRKGAFGRTYEE